MSNVVLVLGAGAIVIGQGCEFDYAGTQACKQLKKLGWKVVLVNPNPATIMTDYDVADRTYMDPLSVSSVTAIIKKEKPKFLLPIVGGQSSLNITMALANAGILEQYGVVVLGVTPETIVSAEDRQIFKQIVKQAGYQCPHSETVTDKESAKRVVSEIGFPMILRPSFTLGGLGGGIAYNKTEYSSMISEALTISPQIQVDRSLIGWKEYEMELVIDNSGNCVVICCIENVDPVGVHTGDSVTVTPVMTLTDKEYQRMRDSAIAIMRAVGMRGSGANVQFAVNPTTGEQIVIEMNPRVSRSSALASKATGFPIAKISTMLALGNTLDKIRNECSDCSAALEPALDYVVTKIPGFDFSKFCAEPLLSTSMHATGEVMAIGANFKQSLQKALCGLERGFDGLTSISHTKVTKHNLANIRNNLSTLQENKILYIADAVRMGISEQEICSLTHYDKWFIQQIHDIVSDENSICSLGLIKLSMMWRLKKNGLSDARIARLAKTSWKDVMAARHKLGIRPVYKRVDTCAAEFKTKVAYLYSCYLGHEPGMAQCESMPSDRDKVVILGNGCVRIGQGIEFDYACVHACIAARNMGFETIMINSNPSAVSTDYDISDKLYLEPMTEEHVLEVLDREGSRGKIVGVIVQMGGQTPLKLAHTIQNAGYNVLGTSTDAIDLAEDREKFHILLNKLNIATPTSFSAHDIESLKVQVVSLGYPLILRPSYVLGGESMAMISTDEDLHEYISSHKNAFANGPLLVDKFIEDAIEVDVEVLADGTQAIIAGIMEHIEATGVHSGDSACSMPTRSIPAHVLEKISRHSIDLAMHLRVVGLMNVQFAITDDIPYVLEANPRASRTIPFVAKFLGIHIAQIATKIMLGQKICDLNISLNHPDLIAVKVPVFPFNKFRSAETILGPQMRSTGETMGMDNTFGAAFAKAFTAAGNTLPMSGNVFISICQRDKSHPLAVTLAKKLVDLGFKILATHGTAEFLRGHGIEVRAVNKVRQGRPHIIDTLINREISLIINTTEGAQSIKDSHSIRRTAIALAIPCITTLRGGEAIVEAIQNVHHLSLVALQDMK